MGGDPAPAAPSAAYAEFALERFFAKHEFTTPHLLCSSDCEPQRLRELLRHADAESLRLWEELSLGYTESQGLPLLRAEIAKLYAALGPDELTVVAPQEGIFLAMEVLVQPGDTIICTYPGYQSLYERARSLGCTVHEWRPQPDPATGRLRFRMEELERLLRAAEDLKMVVVNFPHNPTGKSLRPEEWRRLFELLAARGPRAPYLFSDEMYRGLEHDPAQRLPSAVDMGYERAVALSGVSKALSLPGLRIGWLATKDARVLAAVAHMKDYTTICSSAPSEVLALMGLRQRERLIADNLATITENLKLFAELAARHPTKLAWDEPDAGSTAFPRFLPRVLGKEDVGEVCDRLAETWGVLFLPATAFNCAEFVEQGRFRFGPGRKNLQEGFRRFEEFLEAVQEEEEETVEE